jgi:Gpi18-like mannosyltransferase
VYVVSLVVQNVVLSALVVSFAASVGAGYFLFRLVALDADEATAWRAVLLLFSFPTAYYLAAPFTEALFLFAVLASVYAARTGRWAEAGVAGALAPGPRVTGIALARPCSWRSSPGEQAYAIGSAGSRGSLWLRPVF